MSFRQRVVGIVFCALLALAGQVMAQEEAVELETVTVTAEKTEADAQKVAIPITTLSQVDLEDRGIDKFDDLTGSIPNLRFISSARPGGGSFNFRGIGMFGMSVISEKSPVVVNFDGIPWEGRFSLLSNFDDVANVEFLRGPQGTLYGKNAMGGVLNIATVQPDNEFHGKAGLSMEENSTYRLTARVQGPMIEDKLFFYVSGAGDKTDGWLTDHTSGGERNWDHEENKQLFTKLLYTPMDRFTAALQYGYGKVDAGNAPWITTKKITYDTTTGFTDPDFNTSSHDAALKMDYDFGSVTLTSLSTMRLTHTDSNQYFGLPDPSFGFDDIDEDIFSEEIRLASNNGPNQFNWLGGLFYSRENMKRSRTGYNFQTGPGAATTYDYPTTIDSNIYSTFGQVSIPVFTEKLILTLGGRYEYVDRKMNHTFRMSNYYTGAVLAKMDYSIDKSWDTLLGKVALSYELTDDLMIYGSVSQGYTAGGFNYLELNPNNAPFDAQKSLDYELGLKAMLWGNRLMINPNIFYTEYTDLQISQQVAPMQYAVVNAGKAHALGVEVDWRAKLSSSLEMYGSLGIIEAKFDEYNYDNGLGSVDCSGKNMVQIPNYTVDLGATYRIPEGFFASVDLKCYGKNYMTTDNSPAFTQDALQLVNGKIGWEFKSGLETYLYVTNLFDKKYFTEASPEYNLYMVGQPRTVGMQLAYRF